MESKSAGNLRSTLDPVHTGAMAKKINTNVVARTCKRNLRSTGAHIARIERLREEHRLMMIKTHGDDYAFWIDNLYFSLQYYLPEDIVMIGLDELDYAA